MDLDEVFGSGTTRRWEEGMRRQRRLDPAVVFSAIAYNIAQADMKAGEKVLRLRAELAELERQLEHSPASPYVEDMLAGRTTRGG